MRGVVWGGPLGLVTAGMAGYTAFRRAARADLRGQTALITGGSRGLGLLLAREFGRAGCNVAICARDEEELARAQASLAEWTPETAVLAVTCDVTDPARVRRLVEQVTARFGAVDILVNDAGIIQVGPAEAMNRADYEQALDLMFWGLFNTTEAVLPLMRARGAGRIVNITSVGGKVSVPHLLPYSCAKFAAVGFSEGLRAELARQGISVTTVCPGEMRTGSFQAAEFKGRQTAEYAWFATSSSLPFLAMDAERAARQIVAAARRGQAECIPSLPANVLVRFHGLFPGATANLLGLAARWLPGPDGHEGKRSGAAVDDAAPNPLVRALTRMGRAAARRYNEPEYGSSRAR